MSAYSQIQTLRVEEVAAAASVTVMSILDSTSTVHVPATLRPPRKVMMALVTGVKVTVYGGVPPEGMVVQMKVGRALGAVARIELSRF